MSAIILMWNPDISSYTKEHFEKDLNEFNTIDEDWYNWSVWEHEKVEESNDFYLVRVGKGNTGIVMSGTVISEPYLDNDWSGKARKTYYVDLDPDVLIDSDKVRTLTTEELEHAIPNFNWQGGHSGRMLNEKDSQILKDLWTEFIERNLSVFEEGKYAKKREWIYDEDEDIEDDDYEDDDYEDDDYEDEDNENNGNYYYVTE